MKVDFDKMTKNELRAYLIKHPNNKSAFQAFVDCYTSETSSTTYSMAETPEDIQKVDNLIRRKVTQSKSS